MSNKKSTQSRHILAIRLCRRLYILLHILISTSGNAQHWEYLGLQDEVINAIQIQQGDEPLLVGTRANYSTGHAGKIFKVFPTSQTVDTVYNSVNVNEIAHCEHYQIAGTGGVLGLPIGLLKTIDSGNTWFWSDSGIFLSAELAVTAIAIHPLNTDTIFLGTGGFGGGSLYRSFDAGISWENIGAPEIMGGAVSEIAINPSNHEEIFIGIVGFHTLLRSRDGGNTFELLAVEWPGSLTDIYIDPINPSRIYLSFWQNGLHFSENSGDSWVQVGGFETDLVADIESPVADTNLIFIATAEGIYRSTDSGQSWIPFNQGIDNPIVLSLEYDNEHNTLYCGALSGLYMHENPTTSIVDNFRAISPTTLLNVKLFPTPTNNTLFANIELASTAQVKIRLFTLDGKNLNGLHTIGGQSGINVYRFHETSTLPSGLYIVQVEAANELITRKFTIVK